MHGCVWVPHSTNDELPQGAIRGGTDADGTSIYICRCHHEGDVIPGKLLADKSVAYVAYCGEEHAKYSCEVLVKKEYNWIPSSNGHVPPNAVAGGHTRNGDTLYVARAHHCGSVTVGKLHTNHGCAFISFGGQEHSYTEYEVLVFE